MPGIGFAMSIERVLLALKTQGIELPIARELDCFIVGMGEEAQEKAFLLLDQLRRQGLAADLDFLGRKMKAQLKAADRLQAKTVAILGEDELARGVAVLKDMATGEQQEIAFEQVAEHIQSMTQNEQ